MYMLKLNEVGGQKLKNGVGLIIKKI